MSYQGPTGAFPDECPCCGGWLREAVQCRECLGRFHRGCFADHECSGELKENEIDQAC